MTNRRPVALVTGGGRGIGAVIARFLGLHGYDIALHYWDAEAGANRLSQELAEEGARCFVLHGDLTESAVASSLVDRTLEEFNRIDALVNNAGVMLAGPFLTLPLQDIEHSYAINFRAPYLVAQGAARAMIELGVAGSIVHITSVHQERVSDRDSVYGAMKAALARATESMAYELAPHGIRVNSVAPGRILVAERRTPNSENEERHVHTAIPLSRSGTPEEVAQTVAWLLSPSASYVTGITVRVDGGLNLPMNRAMIDQRLRFI